MTPEENMTGYRSGHPWYYVRGGRVLRLKEIREAAFASGYKGYRERDITAADCKDEPRRSETLRAMRVEAVNNLQSDIRRYLELKRQLCQYRRSLESQFENRSPCNDIHVNISLKHNHMFNEFAHLIAIDELLSRQGNCLRCSNVRCPLSSWCVLKRPPKWTLVKSS